MRCPACAQSLDLVEALALGCENGHRFDANKRGYLNLVDPSRGISGDPRQLLDARGKFLALGHYEPIARGLVSAVAERSAVLDAGCGTGYYLKRLVDSGAGGDALVLDVSVAAVAIAALTTSSPGLVADVWKPLPLRAERADAIVCVFAPRNAAEFARILRPDGRLVVVTPAPHHLAELRAAGLLMGIQPEKRERLGASLSSEFALESTSAIEFTMELDAEEARLLTTMGPSGHHGPTEGAGWAGGTVTAAVDLTVWARATASS